jgi:hypothetical protein
MALGWRSKRMTRSLLVVTILCFSAGAYAAESEVGEGYDENTTVTTKGTVLEVVSGQRGPVRIVLKAANAEYTIITAPPWYLAEQGVVFKTGDSYEVKGSKFISRDGALFLMAGTLKDLATKKVTNLRDADHRPLWRGGRRGMPSRDR